MLVGGDNERGSERKAAIRIVTWIAERTPERTEREETLRDRTRYTYESMICVIKKNS